MIGESFSAGFSSLKRDGSFVQNYAVLLSGAGLNIVVQILVAPILTRVYGPEAYGLFSLFNAVTTNLALVAGFRLPQALQLPEERNAAALTQLSLLGAFFFSILLTLILFFRAEAVLSFVHAERLASYYWLIPIMTFLLVANQVAGQWQYRIGAFKKSTALDTATLVGVRLFNLGFGLVTGGFLFGLILGDLLGKTSGLLLSWKLIVKEKVREIFRPIPWPELKSVLGEYKSYPLFNLPGTWISLMSDQLVVFYISSVYGLQSIGLFSLATSMLDLPKRLLAYSATSVFYKKAVDLHNESIEALRKLVIRMVYVFLFLGTVPYAILVVLGPDLFSWVFGHEWRESGVLAQYLSLYCIFELIYVALDSVYYVLRKEKRLFTLQLSGFFLRLLAFGFCYAFDYSLEMTISIFTAVNLLLYSIQLVIIFSLVQVRWWIHLPAIYAVTGLVITFFFLLRWAFLMLLA